MHSVQLVPCWGLGWRKSLVTVFTPPLIGVCPCPAAGRACGHRRRRPHQHASRGAGRWQNVQITATVKNQPLLWRFILHLHIPGTISGGYLEYLRGGVIITVGAIYYFRECLVRWRGVGAADFDLIVCSCAQAFACTSNRRLRVPARQNKNDTLSCRCLT